ncbi:porphobilinogen synthase [Pectinatus sottacetonis]|uniref:porphobilinogen synthase n=1 Tax=Pectinatus sottacetonis TaxID=1002795 RepID=UPI0018C49FF8|nr:porphobilinogen synthase [Pectinatus sottacetonis]
MNEKNFPQKLRPRRMRITPAIRSMIRETEISVKDFIYPIFVVAGKNVMQEIPSMPDCYRISVDNAVKLAKEIWHLGILAVEVFGLPEYKDEIGSSAWDMKSPVQRAIDAIKQAVPEMTIVGDVCLCQYTTHGHCGKLCGHYVDNDATLELLQKVAVSQAKAGADIVAPSDMMDGRVAAIRQALDDEGFINTSIMSYAVKYASGYYGPFRDAADSAPSFGDRRSYQMDPANAREAIKEVDLDLQEGADMIIVKPALAYLDIVRRVREHINLPLITYNVSGEYAMVKAAAKNGWIDEKRIVLETLTSMKRAGADSIITYHAIDAAKWLREKE